MESKDVTSLNTTKLDDQDWFNGLIKDCKSTIVETGLTARWVIVEGYHALGKRIAGEKENFTRSEIYGKNITKIIAEKINKSESTVEKAIQFYKKYPDLSLLPEGKNTSWGKICQKYLPEPKELPISSNSKDEDISNEPVLTKTAENSNIPCNVLDLNNFSLRNILDLFLEANAI